MTEAGVYANFTEEEKLLKEKGLQKIRYEIWEHYFGKYDEKRIVATCRDYESANMVVQALQAAKGNRPFEYSLKLVDKYIPVLDDKFDASSLFQPNEGEEFDALKTVGTKGIKR